MDSPPSSPHSFAPIRLPSADDLIGDAGTDAFLDWYDTSPPSASELATRLVARQPGRRRQKDKFAEWIDVWNNTRTGVSATSTVLLALQLAARDEFGAPTPFLRKELAWERVRKIYDESGEFLRAMYEWTQEELSDREIEGAVLWRGSKGGTPGYYLRTPEDRNFYADSLHLNPLAAFTFDLEQAIRFSGPLSGAICVAYIPRSRFLATPLTGMGVLAQTEIIGTGGENDRCFWKAWENSQEAQTLRNQNLSVWLELVENFEKENKQ